MLYDPKWEVQTKPDVFSLESLIAWLEKQPCDAAYDFTESSRCMVAQYLRSLGEPEARCDLFSWELDAKYPGLVEIANGSSSELSWTFGAALERARAALSAAR